MKRRRLWFVAPIPIAVWSIVGLSFSSGGIVTRASVVQSPDQVWSVLTDFPSYGKWNHFIPKISGELAAGKDLEVTFNLVSGGSLTVNPQVLSARQPTEFRWLGHLIVPRLFDGEHYWILKPRSDGGTEIVHGENFRGVLVAFGSVGELKADLERMNQDMARELTNRYPANSTVGGPR